MGVIMAEQSRNQRLLELHKAYHASGVVQILGRFDALQSSLKIVLSNCEDLEETISQHVSDHGLIAWGDREKEQAVQDDLFKTQKHLHNTVAAANSLVDHTRS